MPTTAILVDDDPFMLRLLETMLVALGVTQIQCAETGQEALEMVEQSRGDCVCFVDLHMPSMDGLELIRHLSTRVSCAGVVLMSAEDQRILYSAEQLAKAQGVRVVAALRKPIKAEALKQVMAKLPRPADPVARRPTASSFTANAEDLRRGIAANELVVFYQPRVSLRSKLCTGLEALVRWQHPEAGLIGPAGFVPLAETSGLIDALTSSVFEQGIRDLSDLRLTSSDLQLSLNATVDTLARLDFTDELLGKAARHAVPLRSLIVEVTESRLADQFDRVLETLTRLRLHRVGVAIDDFGTGYSSMEQLRRIPFTELKLDRQFVSGAHQDATTRAILDSSVALANQLVMSTVAEGVETQADWELVCRIGCDEAQGYFLARPMPKAAVLAWLKTWRGPIVSDDAAATP